MEMYKRVESEPLSSLSAPCKVSPFYEQLIRASAYYEELRRTVEPSPEELQAPGRLDTSGESDSTVVPGLQHKYPQTGLVLVTNECFSYCRFCFRRRMVGISSEEVATDYVKIADYIEHHPEMDNILLSGGDPFTLPTSQLHEILDHLLSIAHLDSIRFGTKAIVFDPQRFQDSTLPSLFERILGADKVPVMVIHVNHFAELSNEAEGQIRILQALGVQFLSQTVLLNGVNNSAEVLASTFCKLHSLGVRPYYLFQARPVQGASHFQVPLRQGVEIVQGVCQRLSGMQKTFRYIMSHWSGKIEILDLAQDNRLYMRYHQHRDVQRVGRIFSMPYREGACWLDDLPVD